MEIVSACASEFGESLRLRGEEVRMQGADAARPMRADAKRNYDRIVATAKELFSAHGADVPLDDIAKAANVGAGTLYRHFPTREKLVDAVMQAWVERVNDAVGKVLAEGGTSRELLLRWFEQYVELISVHKGGP